MAIEVTRKELTAAELRGAAAKLKDSRAARRMLAIAFVLEGVDRTTAATTCGMDRQALRDWVHRSNAEGLAGLANRRSPGASPLLTPEQKAALAALVEAGPDLQRDGVVRWRRIDLQARIKALFGVQMHERTVGKQLATLSFGRLSVRPRHPKTDEGTQETFKNFPAAVVAVLPWRLIWAAKGKPLEVWFQDEARFGQQGTLTRVWARLGTRPRALRDTLYEWAYLFGAACPGRGVAAGLVLAHVNTAAMNLHLAEIASAVAPGAHAVLVLDGAGWHGGKDLIVPNNITLITLPPYSPELNPVENVWQYLRANKLANTVFDSYDKPTSPKLPAV